MIEIGTPDAGGAAALQRAACGARLSHDEALALEHVHDVDALAVAAAALRDEGFGDLQTYSRKVFIPLTQLCRDQCGYCTFARHPRAGTPAYLQPEEVLAIAEAGRRAGCKEALFTLGDKPELRHRVARDALQRLGYESTLAYLEAMAGLVHRETGLLPHLNAGVMTQDDFARLRDVAVSMGLMLETASGRLSQRGGPHFGSPDKLPSARLACIEAAGEARVAFTSGILIGIGETRRERIEALLALRERHERHGHLQEIIVQNFRAKPGTRMALASEPSDEDHRWTIAVARLVFGAHMPIQAPPNLRAGSLRGLIDAGINDWGGVSPVTIDHVNPEKPWPSLQDLAADTAQAGKVLVERLAIHPAHLGDGERWLSATLHTAALRACDARGLARTDAWRAGDAPLPPDAVPAPQVRHVGTRTRRRLNTVIDRAARADRLSVEDIVTLFDARGDDAALVCEAADAVRQRVCGDAVTYVVNRNINYTNICHFRCQFCAFSKGRRSENLRGPAYNLDLDEIARRTREAWERGASEVCLQGGIHPAYTGSTYVAIVRAVKQAVPAIHVHAFSPLEIWQGASTLGEAVPGFLARLRDEGLGTLPGTAAEVLDDEVRRVICPDKITTAQWLEVMEAAHRTGLRSTATIMFGHADTPVHWARHLALVRELQSRTGGFTEFVPLAFVPMETPIFRKGRCRNGPTFREAVLMHAVARLALHGMIPNIQTSWVKMGPRGAAQCLRAGANDLGGTLMNESITRAAGAVHGQEMGVDTLHALVRSVDREPRQRTTLYGMPSSRLVSSH